MANLLGSGLITILVGLGWSAAFIHFDRPVLAALNADLVVFGITLVWFAYQGRLAAAASLAGHLLPFFIAVACLFDTVPVGVYRATHLHFLAVALGGYFVFRDGSVYMKYVMPACCLIGFVVFSNTSISFHDPKLVIPASAAEIGAWTNTLIAMGELIFIVVIMNADLSVRRTMDVEMRKAIANGDFQLHYQPQINEAGRVVGAEVLIRWRHAKMGNVPPVKFIPLAEETGLIVPIGNWVLRSACAQLAQWEAQQHTQHLTMAVNVSASQFRQPDFVQTVSEIIRLSGVTPSKLKLELTESMFIDNVDATVAKMIALKAIGISWSLDDFGTGYSSLSVLNRFPLGQIKIDKSFVRDMLTNARNMVVTQAIIELAGKLNLQVIAEGVETREQLNRLREVGCLNYQGYFFSPPLDIDAFGTFLSLAPSKSKTFS
ncbi:bifunctional diguanylate cyclase/phosphodiesterase [Acidocella sp. MX-AZ02]|uniref:putative bifunctional diguanylate cyclase/phosphodiesterase n=1 Tax=Acidocella sp. MX-AZ02 TaxID=1214225 RepID=UPI00028CB8D3|nr:EAL domain-containing protein [Acidocella sp. MX-AZ02]EKN01490.1 cylclic diguanylate phosphodiesterase [Acidocella sp. MX-AZ02]